VSPKSERGRGCRLRRQTRAATVALPRYRSDSAPRQPGPASGDWRDPGARG